MDTAENIMIFGNQNLPEGTPERPLVTFALFAYNQEKYIREAIEGAFAQTYEPLEIILSDDCSSDRTFEIIQEMAVVYQGPHRVIARRTAWNLGTAQHVYSAFHLSQGSLFVVAAGDDISLPNRVTELVKAWTDKGQPCAVIHSGRHTFSESPASPLTTVGAKKSKNGIINDYLRGKWLPAAAPTCAYTRELFENFPPLSGGSIIEDAPLLLRGALIGEFISIEAPLVMQRSHENNSGTGYNLANPARWNRFIQSKIIAFTDMKRDLALAHGNVSHETRAKIENRIIDVLKSAPKIILPTQQICNPIEKAELFLKLSTSKAISSNPLERLIFSLKFIKLDHPFIKKLYIFKYRNTR